MAHLKPRHIENLKCHVKALLTFFGDMPLNEISPASFIAYQTERSKVAASGTVNKECAILKKLLKKSVVNVNGMRTTLWEPLEEYYVPLPAREWQKPKVFTPAEDHRIFETASHDPNLELAEIVFTITRNTSASGSELRGMQLKHLELNAKPPRFSVPLAYAKNGHRARMIPLNSDALAAVERAVLRAARLGSHRPDDHLFPLCISHRGQKYDPKRPASPSWLQKQTRRLRKESGVAHLNPHIFRHQFATELLENPEVSEETAIALCGWINRRMLAVYSHSRIEAKFDAVRLLEKKPSASAEITNKKILRFPQK